MLNAFLGGADKREQLLIVLFLDTGARYEEGAHMEWSDFDEHDGGKIRVTPKLQSALKVKDHEVRDIDLLPGKFVRKIVW